MDRAGGCRSRCAALLIPVLPFVTCTCGRHPLPNWHCTCHHPYSVRPWVALFLWEYSKPFPRRLSTLQSSSAMITIGVQMLWYSPPLLASGCFLSPWISKHTGLRNRLWACQALFSLRFLAIPFLSQSLCLMVIELTPLCHSDLFMCYLSQIV